MRVLIVSENHISSYMGGNEVYAHTLASELSRLGHEIDYMTAVGDADFQGDYSLHVVPGLAAGNQIVPLVGWFKKVLEIRPEIVHASGSGIGITLLGGFCRAVGIKSVLTFQAPQTGSVGGRLDEAVQIRLFDRIIATSPRNETYLKKRTKTPVSTVLLCLKNNFHCDQRLGRTAARKRLDLSQKLHYVFMTAKLDEHHYYKGVETAIQAMKKLPGTYKLLIGGGGALLPHYREMARTIGVGEQVIFLGYVPQEKQPLYYQAADVVIMPSTNESEGFGLALLEAMMCKTPVVTTECVGIADLLKKKGIAKIIEPRNAIVLAGAIRRRSAAKGQIQRAYEFALSRTAEAMALETEAVYAK